MRMGQSNSQPTTPRGPPPRPKEQPSAKLVSGLGPQGPSYHQPENRVLPGVLPDIKDVKLRPVSQELSQYHPDFKDIFQNEDGNGNEVYSGNIGEADKENMVMNGNLSRGADHMPNGSPYKMNGNLSNGNTGVYSDNGYSDANGELRMRPQSMVITNSGKIKGHRRQVSASSSLYTRENTIIEDPAESLDNRGKIDPISMDTSYTSQVSIPVKNTFDLDRSYNMTYAQLAEARRNKTLLELEKKTGRKIEDLSADIAEFTNDGSDFVRQASTRSAKSSSSSKSVDSGLKKKKRAPPPPTQPPPPPTSSAHAPHLSTSMRSASNPAPPRPINPPMYRKSHSFDNEPPIDYDMDVQFSSPPSVTRSHSVRSAPAVNVRAPPPPPPPNAPPPPPLQGILRNSTARQAPERPKSVGPATHPKPNRGTDSPSRAPTRTQSFKSPPVQPPAVMTSQPSPLLLEIKKRAEEKALRRQQSETQEDISFDMTDMEVEENELLNRSADFEDKEERPNLVFASAPTTPRIQTKSQENMNNPKLQRQNSVGAVLNSKDNPDVEMTSPSPMQRQNSTTSSSSAVSSNDPNGAMRRLSSLLQHDIKIAAQAKATKIVKHTTPVKEKPKDPAQVFREQLEKAAAEREARVKKGETIDAMLHEKQQRESAILTDDTLFKTDQVVVKRSDSLKKADDKKKEEIIIGEEDMEEFPRPKFVKKDSVGKKKGKAAKSPGAVVSNSRQRKPDSDEDEEESKDYRRSVYSGADWTPEADLSDDNLSDPEAVTSRKGQTEGFKTSIVPGKVNDLKSKKEKQEKAKHKDKRYKKSSDSSADEKRKFDSIKRFKKSVHKSMAHAFGSISKASGKILKKNKSEELFTMEEPEKNWKLEMSSSQSAPNFDSQNTSDKAFKYLVPNGYADHKSDDEEESSEDESYLESSISADSKQVEFSESNGRGGDNEESDNDDDEESVHTMKRAGVAYINKHGQVVLLPEYETVRNGGKDDFEGRAPKIIKQKKKFAFDATVRRKEKEVLEEKIAADVKEKERVREEEKRKEKETEAELKRIRELEARDRLQRLELQAQMQQQLLQQQQQYGMITAPPLPPPSGFQQGYNPSALEWNLPGVPYGSQPTFNGPLFNAGVPGVTYDISDYMRMVGMQGGQPNSQQYAFMLNSMVWPNPLLDASTVSKSSSQLLNYPNNKIPSDDSQRNQVYQAWVGPAKQPASAVNGSSAAQKYIVNDTSTNSVPRNMQYEYGASNSNDKSRQRTNPLYADDSDGSDGLSPQKSQQSMVARIQVGDHRNIPSYGGREEPAMFKSSISVPNLSMNGKQNGDIR